MKLLAKLVGQRFYRGALAACRELDAGDPVLLVREPSNSYDPNAVAVYLKIGHISRKAAATVAPSMDNNDPGFGRKELMPAKLAVSTDGLEVEIDLP